MADNIQKLLEKLGTGATKVAVREASKDVSLPTTTSKDDALSSLNSQIGNLTARLEGAGIDPTKFTDTRNPLEKFLNLRENQNVIFDIFEVLNRPQQALFGGITEALEGGDFGEGLDKGWTGKDRDYSGGGVLRALTTGSRKDSGAIDWTDFAGFALDVFADPADIATLGTGSVAKALNVTSDLVTKLDNVIDSAVGIAKTTKDTVLASKTLKQGADILNVMKKTGKVTDVAAEAATDSLVRAGADLLVDSTDEIAQATDTIVQAMPTAAKKQYLAKFGHNYKMIRKGEKFVSPSDLVMRGMFGTAKSAFEMTDDVLAAATTKFGGQATYEGVKSALTRTFDASRGLAKGTAEQLKRAVGNSRVFQEFAAWKFKALDEIVDAGAKATGQDPKDVSRKLLNYFSYIEDDTARELRPIGEILDKHNFDVYPYDEAQYQDFLEAIAGTKEEAAKLLPVVEIDGQQWVSIASFDKKYLKPGSEILDKQILPRDIRTSAQIAELEALKVDPQFQALYEKFKPEYQDLIQRGTNLSGLTNYEQSDAYVRNTLTEDAKYREAMEWDLKDQDEYTKSAFIGNTKTTSRRAYPVGAQQANTWSAAGRTERFRLAALEGVEDSFKFKNGNPIVLDSVKVVDPTQTILNKKVVNTLNRELEGVFMGVKMDIADELSAGYKGVPNLGVAEDIKLRTYSKAGRTTTSLLGLVDSDEAMDKLVRAKIENSKELEDYLMTKLNDADEVNRVMANIPDTPKVQPVAQPIMPEVAPKVAEVPQVEPTVTKSVSSSPYAKQIKDVKLLEPSGDNYQFVDSLFDAKGNFRTDSIYGQLSQESRKTLADAAVEHKLMQKHLQNGVSSETVEKMWNDQYNEQLLKVKQEVKDILNRSGVEPTVTKPGQVVAVTELQKQVQKDLGYIYEDMVNGKLQDEDYLKLTESTGFLPKNEEYALHFDKAKLPQNAQDAIAQLDEAKKAWNVMPFGEERDAAWQALKQQRAEVGAIIKKSILGDTTGQVAETAQQGAIKLGKASKALVSQDAEAVDEFYESFVRSSDRKVAENYQPNILKADAKGQYKLTDAKSKDLKYALDIAINDPEVRPTQALYDAMQRIDAEYGTDFSKHGFFQGFQEEVAQKATSEVISEVAPKVEPVVTNAMDDVKSVLDDVEVKDDELKKVSKNVNEVQITTDAQKAKILTKMRADGINDFSKIDTPEGWKAINAYLKDVQEKTLTHFDEKMQRQSELLTRVNAIPTFEEDFLQATKDWATSFSSTAKNAQLYQAYASHQAFDEIGTEGSLVQYQAYPTVEKTNLLGETYVDVDLNEKMKVRAPSGFTQVDAKTVDDMVRKLTYFNTLLKDENVARYAESLKKLDTQKGAVFMEKNMMRVLERNFPEGASSILKFTDFANNLFKRFKLLTPGFNIRNVMGVTTNMWLSGMSVQEIATNLAKADEIWKDYPRLMQEFANNVDAMLPDDVAKLNVIREFISAGFTPPRPFAQVLQEGLTGTGSELQDIQQKMLGIVPEGGKLRIDQKVSLANGWVNESVDALGRTAVMLKAMDGASGSAYMGILGVNNAAEAVRLAMFDPTNLSYNENSVMRRLIPFYTFTKMNLAYHMENIPANARRYYRMQKAINSTWDAMGFTEEDVEDYKLVNMYLPLPGRKEDGTYFAIKANLPQSDFMEWVNDPLGRLVSASSPLIKAPFEIVSNTNMFTKRPIQDFAGQKSTTIPFLTKQQEYALGQTGLDAPARASLGAVEDLLKGDVGQALSDFTGMGQKGNTTNAKISAAYKELEDLQNGVKYLKQEGITLPTLAELENQDKDLDGYKLSLDQLLKLK